jgi:hypothetical protein
MEGEAHRGAGALTLTEAARRTLEVCQELSLDELCELIKSSDNERSSTIENVAAVMRELINERITPEEERAWVTWWAQHSDDAAKEKALREDALSLLKEVQVLAENGADPASQRLTRLCETYELGDACGYARWAPHSALGNGLEPTEPRHEEEWAFLARALQARPNAG